MCDAKNQNSAEAQLRGRQTPAKDAAQQRTDSAGADSALSKTQEAAPTGGFAALFDKERVILGKTGVCTISIPGRAEEPWVAFTAEDRVGLALSGGGIRSATFNLGLLQALRHYDILKRVDYLSTVSGGGYIGGFWTRWWRAAVEKESKKTGQSKGFPEVTGGADGTGQGPKESREPEAVRHLREFSRFLIPRKGLTAEFWNAAIIILSGLVPSLIAALTLVLFTMMVWAYLAAWLIAAGSLAFSAGDFNQLPLLADKLKHPTRAVDVWLASQLSFDTRLALAQYPDQGSDKAPLKAFLARDFNRVLAGASIYESQRLGGLRLRRETQTLRSQNPRGGDLARLNRLLIEDAYPELSRKRNAEGFAQGRSGWWSRAYAVLINSHALKTGLISVGLTILLLAGLEASAQRSNQSQTESSLRGGFVRRYLVWTGLAALSLLVACCGLAIHQPSAGCLGSLGRGLLPDGYNQYQFNWLLFRPCIALGLALAFLNLVRAMFGRCRKALNANSRGGHMAWSASLERVMGFLLAIQVFWAAMAGVWELARWLIMEASVGGVGGLTAVLAFLFYEVQRRLAQPSRNESPGKVLKWLKPWAPQLLANGIVTLLFVLAAVFILNCGLLTDNQWPELWIVLFCLFVLGVVLLLFDPMSVGLHEFYRARLSRCYLGASQPNDRGFMERPTDDMLLKDDAGKPIHLICCAANQLSGDPLGTLHRGARSAVLSRHGIAVGNHHIADEHLRLSSAMTASAAAFNPLMGELNMKLGRAVSFVMTTLNLRLGLWVNNPASPTGRWFPNGLPGRFFFKEMLGWAECTDQHPAPHIHLSDGGHFENLAFYELIRRHCRYVLVSDAGQDQDFAFSDFGRAVRRVREDFGVEIEIDLTPLKPGSDRRLSQQHVAVGTIHYDGVAGTDKGTIVYFKPTLTGDEPPDVQQYRQRNELFPHESTGDQFFDEAQWESYRRLGEHACHASLRMLQERPIRGDPQKLFRAIRLHWQRVPWMEGEGGIRLCEHATALQEALREHASPALRKEFVGHMLSTASTIPAILSSPAPPTTVEQSASDALWAIGAFKFMEEVWLVCELDQYCADPLAANWMSHLQRWAAMPTVRYWWPLVRPLFGTDFQAFANKRLHLSTVRSDRQVTLELSLAAEPKDGFAWRRLKQCRPEYNVGERHPWLLDPFKRHCLSLEMVLSGSLRMQVGVAIIGVKEAVASWGIDDLFVPPELRGGTFRTVLLDKVIEHFKKTGDAKSLQLNLDRTWFSAVDFLDLLSLKGKLTQGTREVDSWLAEQLSPRTKTKLKEYSGQDSDPALLKVLLSRDLNRVLAGRRIDEPLTDKNQRFRNFKLRSETEALRSQSPKGGDLRLLNCLLVEDAYPQELKTAARLQRDRAARHEQVELIDFYRSRGFQFDSSPGNDQWVGGQNIRMIRQLS